MCSSAAQEQLSQGHRVRPVCGRDEPGKGLGSWTRSPSPPLLPRLCCLPRCFPDTDTTPVRVQLFLPTVLGGPGLLPASEGTVARPPEAKCCALLPVSVEKVWRPRKWTKASRSVCDGLQSCGAGDQVTGLPPARTPCAGGLPQCRPSRSNFSLCPMPTSVQWILNAVCTGAARRH